MIHIKKPYFEKVEEYMDDPNAIVVFGSNVQGMHGAGLAKVCLNHFGAVYGQARGLQGRSYAIVTKDLSKKSHPSVDESFILLQLNQLEQFARQRPHNKFLVTAIGTGLAGFELDDIFDLIYETDLMNCLNVIFCKEIQELFIQESVKGLSIQQHTASPTLDNHKEEVWHTVSPTPTNESTNQSNKIDNERNP